MRKSDKLKLRDKIYHAGRFAFRVDQGLMDRMAEMASAEGMTVGAWLGGLIQREWNGYINRFFGGKREVMEGVRKIKDWPEETP